MNNNVNPVNEEFELRNASANAEDEQKEELMLWLIHLADTYDPLIGGIELCPSLVPEEPCDRTNPW